MPVASALINVAVGEASSDAVICPVTGCPKDAARSARRPTFAVTVPVGLLALGAVGVARGWQERRVDLFPLLLVATIVFFLGLFSTRVPVYDGERLFLHVFPAWALLVGYGFGWLWDHRMRHRIGRIVLGGFLIAQIYGTLAMHPFGLSYYNALIGGLPGAERAGLDAAKYAGHSLRAGHATSAAIAGASERSIMNQTGHRSVQMVRRYIRDGSLFRENSAGKLGL